MAAASASAPASDPIVEALKEYTTSVSTYFRRNFMLTFPRCDVSDALCKLKFPNGGFLSGLTMWSPQRQDGPTKIIGPAYTVKYQPKDDPAPKHPTHYVSATAASPQRSCRPQEVPC